MMCFNTLCGLFSEVGITTVLVFLCTFVLVYMATRRKPGTPPGPPCLPIVGNLLSLASFRDGPLVQMEKLRKQYGDIYGLYMGNELFVYLNGYDMINEAFIKRGSLFVNRPILNLQREKYSLSPLMFANGEAWKRERTFTLKGMSECFYSNSSSTIEDSILIEAVELRKELKHYTGAIDVEKIFMTCTANVICALVYNRRFQYNDKSFVEELENISESAGMFFKLQILNNCFPLFSRLPGDIFGMQRYGEINDSIVDWFKPVLKQTVSAFDGTNRCIVDTFCAKRKLASDNLEDEFTTTPERVSAEDSRRLCFEMQAAGTETTSTALLWLMLYLIRNPSIQTKMFEEIRREIGTDTLPSLAHRKKLVYTEAVALEALRMSTPVPLGLPHTVSRDTMFRGYLLEENCTILMNIHSCLKDPSVWKDPDVFRPERFLRDSGTVLDVPREFIPFGLGARSCLGESLARMELFLLLASLVQAFEFQPEEDGVIPDVRNHLGSVMKPTPFRLKFVERA